MKTYPRDEDYVERQRKYNWLHTNGQLENEDDWNRAVELAESLKRLTKDFLPKTILVVGCRTGYESFIFQEVFDTLVVGVEIVPEFVKRACLKTPTLQCDMHNIKLPSESFDLVICSGTLEHAYDPDQAAGEMCRVTKDVIYVAVDLEEDRDKYLSHYSFSTSIKEWLKLFTKRGFKPFKVIQDGGQDHCYLHAYLRREKC